jgi:hypothetical protein
MATEPAVVDSIPAADDALLTEKSVGEIVGSIKRDLARAAELFRQGNEILRYVERNTNRWLANTPGRLKVKVGEVEQLLEMLKQEPSQVAKEMLGDSGLPAVEVIVQPRSEPVALAEVRERKAGGKA